jgi:hypothetical protein
MAQDTSNNVSWAFYPISLSIVNSRRCYPVAGRLWAVVTWRPAVVVGCRDVVLVHWAVSES